MSPDINRSTHRLLLHILIKLNPYRGMVYVRYRGWAENHFEAIKHRKIIQGPTSIPIYVTLVLHTRSYQHITRPSSQGYD
jgi:hypothetical protein